MLLKLVDLSVWEADISTRSSKSLLIRNNGKQNFIQLSVVEMFREDISASWTTSVNWYSDIHLILSLKIKDVKMSYCLCIPEVLGQLTSLWSIFILMDFLDIQCFHYNEMRRVKLTFSSCLTFADSIFGNGTET